jgi:hypothetical protein
VCTLIRDPDDICCMKPRCQLQSGSTLIPYTGNGPSGSGTPPTSLQVVPVGTHEVFSGYGKPQPQPSMIRDMYVSTRVQSTMTANPGTMDVIMYVLV